MSDVRNPLKTAVSDNEDLSQPFWAWSSAATTATTATTATAALYFIDLMN